MNGQACIAFQGEVGANSHIACAIARPDLAPLACPTFDDAFAAVIEGEAECAMIPIENSQAGRVAEIHFLLPESGLFVIAEAFLPIRHQLAAIAGATLSSVKRVRSHPQALGQCRRTLKALGLTPVKTADTAGAAREIAALNDPAEACLCSQLAAQIHGLDVLKADIADAADNFTRFVVLSRAPVWPAREDAPVITSIVFSVRNVPAALYKAMGGFATNGINLTKIESYQLGSSFKATQFYVELGGHPQDPAMARALEELQYFSTDLRILGVYPADPFRRGADHGGLSAS